MKYKIVLLPFPFDDLSSTKMRPAVCLTDKIPPYSHIVLAFITSRPSTDLSETDLLIEASDPDFAQTGLKLDSTIRLHRLVTVSNKTVRRELGSLSKRHQIEVETKLRKLFEL